MTTLTLQLPDEVIQKAKRAGVFNEQKLSHVLNEFLLEQIHQQTVSLSQKQPKKTWADFASCLKSQTDVRLSTDELVNHNQAHIYT